MKRRTFMALVSGGLLAAPLAAGAQQVRKIPTIGYLGPGSASSDGPFFLDTFLKALRELGYTEGQNIALKYRWADGYAERLPALAAELVGLKVSVIVTGGTTAIRAAKDATATIPIVMAGGGDPVGSGLVASLARPGGNITGVSLIGKEVLSKGLELLKETIPTGTRVAVLMNAANPASPFFANEMETAASSLGLRVQIMEVRDSPDFDRAFVAMARGQAHALQVLADPMFFLHRQRIADLAIGNRLPTMFYGRPYAEAGGLMSYAVSFRDVYRSAAVYVDKILKGAKPADLPVEQPTKFVFVINLKTAKALGLTIPPLLLLRADEVIQ